MGNFAFLVVFVQKRENDATLNVKAGYAVLCADEGFGNGDGRRTTCLSCLAQKGIQKKQSEDYALSLRR